MKQYYAEYTLWEDYINGMYDNTIINEGKTLLGFSLLSNDVEFYRNGSSYGTSTTVSGAPVNFNFFVNAVNSSGTPVSYSLRQHSLVFIGTGLTDTESANFYTAVQTFQTALSRQV